MANGFSVCWTWTSVMLFEDNTFISKERAKFLLDKADLSSFCLRYYTRRHSVFLQQSYESGETRVCFCGRRAKELASWDRS